MSDKPKVSILCPTYNHEKYIKDAIEGFLMQKTDFSFEIVIHDDASTDGTAHILSEYERRYPELIRVIYETENQFSKFKYPPQFSYNMMRKELKGDYIAWCEGDDYWNVGNKLQMQIDYMEAHPDCVLTGHDAELLNCRTGEKRRLRLFSGDMDISADELISGTGDMTSASLVFKREIVNMDGFFLDVSVGDYPMKLYCLTKGKIHYFDKVMSVYRYLSENSWSSKQKSDYNSYLIRWTNKFVFLERYNQYTNGAYISIIKRFVNKRINGLPHEFSNLSTEQFLNLCQCCDRDSDYEAHKYYIEMMRLFRQYHDVTYINDKTGEFVQKNRHVLIYGAGLYGRLVAEQLGNNYIDFDGFVVSDDQMNENVCQGKKIWKLGELPYMKSEIGIVIAVRTQLKEEILAVLQDNEIENYIYPFEISCDEIIV